MDLTATVLGLLGGRLSAVNLMDELLQRAHKWRVLNAIVFQDHDALMEAATAADLRAADARGPLHGAPLLIKDNIDVSGWPTTCCTQALARNLPAENAAVIERVLGRGALIFGKANMHEMALGVTNVDSLYGPVRNPYDQSRITGGSSGGTAAAVAAGIVPAGLGSDTGGSVRIPAALCGICGLRPSWGRYPMDGVVPVSPTRDTVGPLARSVRDLALLDAVMAGEAVTGLELVEKLRIGVPRDFFFGSLDEAVEKVIESSLSRIAAAGHELIEADIPDIQSLNRAVAVPVLLTEVHRAVPEYLETRMPGLSFAELVAEVKAPDVLRMLAIDAAALEQFTAAYDQAVRQDRPALRAAFSDYFTGHDLDVLLVPATPMTACALDTGPMIHRGGEDMSVTAIYARNVALASTAGYPSLAIPAGVDNDGLPVGLLLEAPPDRDRDLLAAGLTIESLLGALPPPQF